jgi:hypothetical protein
MSLNRARDSEKTQFWSFWKTKKWFKSSSPKIKTRQNENVSVDFCARTARGEFSHSLALHRTAAGRRGCKRGVPRAAVASLGR